MEDYNLKIFTKSGKVITVESMPIENVDEYIDKFWNSADAQNYQNPDIGVYTSILISQVECLIVRKI